MGSWYKGEGPHSIQRGGTEYMQIENSIGQTNMGSLHIYLAILRNSLDIEETGKKFRHWKRWGGYRGDGNFNWLLTICYGTIIQSYLEELFIRSGSVLNLVSPYLRVALDRNELEGKEKESVFNPVELSIAAWNLVKGAWSWHPLKRVKWAGSSLGWYVETKVILRWRSKGLEVG